MIELTKEYIDNLKDIITKKEDVKIKEILEELYPAEPNCIRNLISKRRSTSIC